MRPRVYAVHRSANSVGQALGPLLGGILAFFFGWRAPFLFFAIPTAIFVLLALRLREPIRGHYERRRWARRRRRSHTEEAPPSWAESWRIVLAGPHAAPHLRRAAVPRAAIVGLLTLGSLFYERGLRPQRGRSGASSPPVAEPAQIVGFFIGIPIATRLMAHDPGLVLKFLAVVTGVVAVAWIVFVAGTEPAGRDRLRTS